MKEDIRKWIWQHSNYPNFNYDKTILTKIILEKSKLIL